MVRRTTGGRFVWRDTWVPPLPLPLGEVAERSEDGEGKRRKPSQSPSVTALPKGEPRADRVVRPYGRLSEVSAFIVRRGVGTPPYESATGKYP